jgi:hypothetical protein
MDRSKKPQGSIALGVLTALIAALLTAGIAGGATFAGAELEFAGDTADQTAGQVEVPVECIGGPTGFCAGTLTLSWHGKRSTSTFSVQGGSSDTVAVPLPAGGSGGRAKIAAVATTTQALGPAVTRRAILHLR